MNPSLWLFLAFVATVGALTVHVAILRDPPPDPPTPLPRRR